MRKVGLIGVGAIGKGLLKNLIKNDCEVIAYDISEKGKEEIRKLGGTVAEHPKEVANFSNVIFLSLPGPAVIKELFQGEEGIAYELLNNTKILDLSTIDPKTTREIAELCGQSNSYYFDCPVSGGPTGADKGTLTIMVGGPLEQYESILEYLKMVGLNIKYIGESGMAQVLKLCHNMVVAVNIAALGESFATGVKHGLNVEVMADIIGKSIGSSRALEYFGPNIVNGTYENVKFMLNHMHKDLGLYLNLAKEVGVPSIVATNTFNLYHTAKTLNKGSLDHTAVCQVIEEMAGVKLMETNKRTTVPEVIANQVEVEEVVEGVKKVGLIGVGAMGKGLLKNLIKNGFEVLAYDISDYGKEQIRRLGGLVASHPREVFQFSTIIYLSLPGPKEVKELFCGAGGVLEMMMSSTNILDLSTIDPSTTRELTALCAQHGSYYFDCPVSGGPVGADQGTLTIMVGGDPAQYEKIKTYLNYVGSNITYIGESGIAQTLKLCHNMLGPANVVALGEAFATGVKSGLTVEVMAEVISKGIGNSRTLEYFGPNIVNNTYENVKFMLKHMHKDLGLYIIMTQEAGVPSFIGANVFGLYEAAKTQNKAHLDHTAVCQVIEELACVKIVEGTAASVN